LTSTIINPFQTPYPLGATRPLLAALVVTTCLLAAACSTIGTRLPATPAVSDPAAVRIISDLNRTNTQLRTFKGIGTVRLWKDHTARAQERMAWIGAAPSRLSVVVFASGRPALKLATNGKRLYAVDLFDPEKSFYETRAINSGLKRLLELPVKPSDMVALLRGRLPLVEYRTANVEPDPSGNGMIVSLKQRAYIQQKVFLDQTQKVVRQFEVFDNRGNLLYRAKFDSYRQVEAYRVPFDLVISDDDGNRMHLAIDRYMADVRVEPSMFVLEPPDK
jgi:hypothetical protein